MRGLAARSGGGRLPLGAALVKLARDALCAYIAVVLLLVAFAAPVISYACKKESLVALGPAYLAVAVFAGLGVVLALLLLERRGLLGCMRSERRFRMTLAAVSCALLALQALVVRGGWFVTSWDVAALTDFGNLASWSDYFSTYPNQLFLAGLFARIAEAGSLLGFENGYLCVVAVGCFCVTVSVALSSLAAREVGGYVVGYCVMLLGSVFVGLSPWVLVPYSDAYGMLFTSLVLFSLTCVRGRCARWFSAVLFGVLGYMVKPTVVFALAAAVVVCALDLAGRGAIARAREVGFVRVARVAASAVLAAALALGVGARVRDVGVDIDEDASFTMTHFLMMGFNPETRGVWSGDDVAYSRSFCSVGERERANVDEWLQRVSDAGPAGVAKLLARKSLANYADGTFAWEVEGSFYVDVGGGSDLVRHVYGIGDPGTLAPREDAFAPVAQVLWLLVLVGVALCALSRRPGGAECAMALCLLMLSAFLMFFECRARYLFLYAPWFVLLGVLGWRELARRVRAHSHASSTTNWRT